MKQRILVIDNINGSRLLKTLGINGVNTIGLRVMSGLQLAQYSLETSDLESEKTFISSKEAAALIYSFLKDIPYFANASYTDAKNLVNSLNSLRMLITDDEESKIHHQFIEQAEFKEKNEAIVAVYERYIEYLKTNELSDNVSFLRKAIADGEKIDAEFYELSGYKLNPLEKALVESLGGKLQTLSSASLFERKGDEIRIEDYRRYYGASNEIDYVLGDILRRNLNLDECQLVLADSSYVDLLMEYDIPLNTDQGRSLRSFNAYKVLDLLYRWSERSFNSHDALLEIIESEAFDRNKLMEKISGGDPDRFKKVLDLAGNMRLSFDEEENRKKLRGAERIIVSDNRNNVFNDLVLLSDELCKGYRYLVNEYTLIEEDDIEEQSALMAIDQELEIFSRYNHDDKALIERMGGIGLRIDDGNNSLLVNTIDKAIGSLRKHIYVMGLSADNFPGKPVENYLLLDNDYRLFEDEDKLPNSIEVIEQKKKRLTDFLSCASLAGSIIHLSYSHFDLAQVKEANPSSILFDLYQKQYPGGSYGDFEKMLEESHIGYFENRNDLKALLVKRYSEDYQITNDFKVNKQEPLIKENTFSPSAIEDYLTCPRLFYLARILGIPELEEDDPLVIINPIDYGILTHSLMESLAKKDYTKQSFINLCTDTFDDYLKLRPPVSEHISQAERDSFIRMMENAYDSDYGRKVIDAEGGNMNDPIDTGRGIRVRGIPDRVEQEADGRIIIADYKTGKRIVHSRNDFKSCIQTIIYCFIEEKLIKKKVSGSVYRYLRFPASVVCEYNEQMRGDLNKLYGDIADSIKENNFPLTDENKASCQYCQYLFVCGRYRKEEEDDQ